MNLFTRYIKALNNVGHFVLVSLQEVRHKVSWPNSSEVERLVSLFLTGLFFSTLLVAVLNFIADRITKNIYSLFA